MTTVIFVEANGTRHEIDATDGVSLMQVVIDPKPTSRLCCQVEVKPELHGVIIHLPESQF